LGGCERTNPYTTRNGGNEAMSEQYLTLKQLQSLVEIPENSLKRYIQEHGEFINYDKQHNRYRIHVSAVETIKTIRKLYGDGFKKEAVTEHLLDAGVPVTITVDSEEGKDLISVNEELQQMKEMMQLFFKKTEEDKKELLQEIAELKQLLNRRNADEVANLRKSLEDKKGDAESREKEKEREQQEMLSKIEEATDKAIKDAINSYKEESEGNKSWLQKLFGK